MRWMRSNIRVGTCLCLLALVIQLNLSFGHAHFQAGLALLSAGAAEQVTERLPAAPLKHSNDKDLCAICVNMHLASSAQVPAAAVLHVALMASYIQPELGGDFALSAAPVGAFGARGPPQA